MMANNFDKEAHRKERLGVIAALQLFIHRMRQGMIKSANEYYDDVQYLRSKIPQEDLDNIIDMSHADWRQFDENEQG